MSWTKKKKAEDVDTEGSFQNKDNVRQISVL